MSEILESLSNPALGRATELMYQTATTYLGRIFAARFYQEREAIWFLTDPIGFNKVIHTPITTDTPKSTINEILKTLAVSSANSLTWDIGPSIQSTRLEDCLSANGWSKEGEARSMVLDLHALQRPANPAGLTIEIVDTEERFKHHISTMIAGFEFPEPILGYLSNIDYRDQFLNDPAVRYYVGYVAGQAVTISVVLLCEGIAGIYNVATIPQMRHQGFGTAMTLAALLEALDLGYHIAVLQASDMGVNAYRSLGFRDHFTFDTYTSNPPLPAE
jgi:ribosomal protein S18 acetylase RimI-like enzyme